MERMNEKTETVRIWTPQPKQSEFMRRFEDEALYGGAAGGGKSDCALVEALRQVHIPHYQGIILRKTFPQLTDMIDRSQQLYKAAFPKAKYNGTFHVWNFPSGAKIYFGSMHRAQDRLNYQGKHYDYIDFDELTQFTADEYTYMLSRNRPNGPGTRCYMRAQANPGGIGHGWVKQRFITPAKPMETIWERVKVIYPNGSAKYHYKSRVFVPSNVFDNKALLENDPDYLVRLASLNEKDRQALLYGSWDMFDGQVFTEFRNDPDRYRDRICTHVIEPFQIPDSWQIYRGFDWGYSKPFSVGWYAVDHDGRIYRFRELYGCKEGQPNVGVAWPIDKLAAKIAKIEFEDPVMHGKQVRGIADPAIFQKNGGEAIAEVMERHGVWFERGDHSRIPGKMQIHNRLAFDENGRPMLYVFSTCKHFIRTFPTLIYSQTDVEDVDTSCEDHIYDELRYVCMNHPIAAPKAKQVDRIEVFDPLDSGNQTSNPYAYYLKY